MQKYALCKIIEGKNLFITGGAGVGKSYVINEVKKILDEKDKKYILCAPTGVAAQNIGGATIHRTFSLKIEIQKDTTKKFAKILNDIDVIIIDEISMVRIDVFSNVCKQIMNANKKREKDIQVILVGDFLQLPPVVTDKDKEALSELYGERVFAFESPYWAKLNIETIELDEVIRQNNEEFASVLNQIRKGNKNVTDFIRFYSSDKEIKDGTYIVHTNKMAKTINDLRLSEIDSELKIFETEIEGNVNNGDLVVEEILTLKKGCKIMCLINDRNGLYVNGTQAEILEIKNNKLICKEIGTENIFELFKNEFEVIKYESSCDENVAKKLEKVKEKAAKETDIKKLAKIHEEISKLEEEKRKSTNIEAKLIGKYKNFPCKLAYAITVHKSQGKTLEYVNYEPSGWINEGQVYVALSRCTDINNLFVSKYLSPNYIKANPKVVKFYEGKN